MKGRFLPAFASVVLIVLTGTISAALLANTPNSAVRSATVPARLVVTVTARPSATVTLPSVWGVWGGAGLPHRAESRQGNTLSPEVVVGVIVQEEGLNREVCFAGYDCLIRAVGTVSPTATQPPLLPSFTARPSSTITPPPTNTPRPTATHTPVPAATATSAPTPDAEPKCWGRISAGPLNVRAEPAGAVLGALPEGDTLTLEGRTASADGRLWYQIYWTPDQVGYVYAGLITLGEGAICTFDTAWGLWIGPGANRDELLRFGETLRAAGIQPAATIFGEPETANLLFDAGWIVIFRPWIGDCPDNTAPAEVSARIWWAAVEQAIVGVRFTWLSASNECGWPSAEYLRDWILELDARARAAGIKHLIPTVFNSGAPDLTWLPVLYPAYQIVKAHGGAFGLNQYPVPQALGMTDMPLGEINSWTAFTTYRYMKMVAALPVGLPIIVTEAARSGGEKSPIWDDVTAYVRIVDGSLHVVTIWYFGIPLHPWEQATIRGQGDRLAVAIIRGVTWD